MKKKILIPTDFSKNAYNALTYAAGLYKDAICDFYLLNAYTTTGYTLTDMAIPEPGSISYDNAATVSVNGLEKVMDMLDFRARNHRHTYHIISEFNDPLEAIKNTVEKKDIDLVIMGTKGASNKNGVLFGSNTITAMEKVRNCPVMGVPLDTRVGAIKEIVFPTSFKTHYKKRELVHLVDLARLHQANICIVHVTKNDALSHTQRENRQLLEDCIEGTYYSFHTLKGADPVTAVKIFVQSRGSDMVAFINKKHGFFGSLFTTPMVKELGMFSKVPLLVMHDMRN